MNRLPVRFFAAASKNKKAPKKKKLTSSTAILTLSDVRKQLPDGRPILSGVHANVLYGAKIGVLGENGAGKSTLLKIIAGVDTDFEGIRASPVSDLKFAMLTQEPELPVGASVKDAVAEGIQAELDLIEQFKVAAPEEQRELKRAIDSVGGWGVERRIGIACQALRTPPLDACVDDLSGGERRRVALARILISKNDVLLLDEPTNHLDPHSTFWLEQYLSSFKGTVMAVTHDRYFLDAVASWIVEVAEGKLHPFQGNYSAWIENKAEREELDERKSRALGRELAREREWMAASPSARRKKSAARINRYDDLVARASQQRTVAGAIVIPQGPRLGRLVVRVENASLSLGGKTLLDDVSFELPAGAIVGVVGPNGCGKSSLMRTIAGEVELDAGTVEIGETVHLGFATQSRDDLQEELSLVDEVCGGAEQVSLGPGHEMHARAFVASFGFKGDAALKRIGSLSGGERNRAHLAKVIRKAPNLLILDEPSNDLSVTVLRSLEAALDDYSGTGIVVSHDRFFLDRVTTHTLAFEGEGRVRLFHGSFSDYRRWALEEGYDELSEEARRVLLGPDDKGRKKKKGGKGGKAAAGEGEGEAEDEDAAAVAAAEHKAMQRKMRQARML